MEVRLIKIVRNMLFHLCFPLKIGAVRMLMVAVVGLGPHYLYFIMYFDNLTKPVFSFLMKTSIMSNVY